MTQIPSADIMESLYKLRIRESEKLKTVLEIYKMEIHQKKAGPDYHRLKTMVKRSIEQNLRTKNFEARNGRFETSAVAKNQRVKQRGQEDGSLRLALDRRRRTRKGPEPACVRSPFRVGWHTQEEKVELTSCCGTVQSAWQYLQ